MQNNFLSLADWRRRAADMYSQIRTTNNKEAAWRFFKKERNAMFSKHDQSPLSRDQRQAFSHLDYFNYDPEYCLIGQVEMLEEVEILGMELADEGAFRLTQFAYVHCNVLGKNAQLSLFWVQGYGGGLFLPFRDLTNGRETYSGGRYLYDSIKGADLGSSNDQILLDFNFSYNPSCAYHDRWVCPLAPPQNWLNFKILAGEKSFG